MRSGTGSTLATAGAAPARRPQPPASRNMSTTKTITARSSTAAEGNSDVDLSATKRPGNAGPTVEDLREAILQLLPRRGGDEADGGASFIDVEAPADPKESLIRYDIPYAPGDPKRSLKLRKSLGCGAEERVVDPNVRVVVDSFITPRRWVDPQSGVVWVQHASPFPSTRIEAAETQQRLHDQLAAHQARRTGTSPIRSLLVAECMLEVLRQVTAECWERGLLLLHVHSERVAAQAAHRRLFESRVGHAFRLALKGEKDVAKVEEDMAALRARIELLGQQEAELRQQCSEFERYAEEQVLIANRKHNDALTKLKREGVQKRAQLEQQLVIPPNLQ